MVINYDQLDEETKKKLQNFADLQQTLDLLRQQHAQIDALLKETELVIDELEKADADSTVFKSIGGVMIKIERDKLLAEKKSSKVTLNMNLKTLTQKIERTSKALEDIQKSLQLASQNQ